MDVDPINGSSRYRIAQTLKSRTDERRPAGQSGEIALMAEPVWQFRLSVGNEPLFSVPVRPQGCQTFPNAHPWVSHPIALRSLGARLEQDRDRPPARR